MKKLAKQTFEALERWINCLDCGVWLAGEPVHMIPKAKWENLRRHKMGDVIPGFQPWHVYANYLKPKHIADMIAGTSKHYYTGGKSGQTIIMIDIDAHKDWQTDKDKTLNKILDHFGRQNCFVVTSTRGYNVFLKVSYDPSSSNIYGMAQWQAVNDTLSKFNKVVKAFCSDCLCDVEIKGSITIHENSGTLAKLPCYGTWTEERLAEFVALPVKTLTWLNEAINFLPEPVVIKEEKSVAGSHVPFAPTEDELADLDEQVKAMRQSMWYLYSMHHKPLKKGVKIVREDFDCAIKVISLAQKYRKDQYGDQMPTDWLEYIWTNLYQSGYLPRGWDASRFAAIRNTMADCQFLDVISAEYWFDPDGKMRGKAMEWRLREEFDPGTGDKEEKNPIYGKYSLCSWRPVWVSWQQATQQAIYEAEEEVERMFAAIYS